jgi:type II secretory pathway pseudopilin PulG
MMIVVAIVGLLAALALPAFARSRKRSQGSRIVSDARIIDAAIDQWALDNGKKDGDAIDNWSQSGIVSYTGSKWTITSGSPVTSGGSAGGSSGGALMFLDVLGNAYPFATVGWSPQVWVNYNSKLALNGVNIDWGPY